MRAFIYPEGEQQQQPSSHADERDDTNTPQFENIEDTTIESADDDHTEVTRPEPADQLINEDAPATQTVPTTAAHTLAPTASQTLLSMAKLLLSTASRPLPYTATQTVVSTANTTITAAGQSIPVLGTDCMVTPVRFCPVY